MSFIIERVAREKIADILKSGPKSCEELSKEMKLTKQCIYGLLRRMKDADVITSKRGKPRMYELKQTDCLLAKIWR